MTETIPPAPETKPTAAVVEEGVALKIVVQSLITAVLYLTLFVTLIPPLLRILDTPNGKALYGVLLVGAVLVALRLRHLSRRLSTRV
jgi:hypothetical protein